MRLLDRLNRYQFMTQDISGNALASIGATHGYRFDGDSVRINAEMIFADAALSAASRWALQLWSGTVPFTAGRMAGVKVAELSVYPVAGYQNIAATVAAMPPAGSSEQNMALALVYWGENGQPTVADVAAYPIAERFVQPRLSGNVTCALGNGQATLAVDTIENPRAAGTIFAPDEVGKADDPSLTKSGEQLLQQAINETQDKGRELVQAEDPEELEDRTEADRSSAFPTFMFIASAILDVR